MPPAYDSMMALSADWARVMAAAGMGVEERNALLGGIVIVPTTSFARASEGLERMRVILVAVELAGVLFDHPADLNGWLGAPSRFAGGRTPLQVLADAHGLTNRLRRILGEPA